MLTRKKLWILILINASPCAFEFLGEDICEVSKLRLGKFTIIFEKLSIFQKSDRWKPVWIRARKVSRAGVGKNDFERVIGGGRGACNFTPEGKGRL